MRDDLKLAAFAVAHGFTLQTDRMHQRGDRIGPQHFDAVGIPHDGLQFSLGRVSVWQTARGWRVAALEGEGESARYPQPAPGDFHGRLFPALQAALTLSGVFMEDAPRDDLGRLAQAAPAMLAALQSACDQMEQCESMFRDDAEFMAALEETRAAIAAATGTPTDGNSAAAPIAGISAGRFTLSEREDGQGYVLTGHPGPGRPTLTRRAIFEEELAAAFEALDSDPTAATGER